MTNILFCDFRELLDMINLTLLTIKKMEKLPNCKNT